jgi:hypothetical protein
MNLEERYPSYLILGMSPGGTDKTVDDGASVVGKHQGSRFLRGTLT